MASAAGLFDSHLTIVYWLFQFVSTNLPWRISGRRAELAESEEEPNVYTTLSELNYFCDQMEIDRSQRFAS